MISVITIARQFGSGGGVIAQRVAERLGWTLLDDGLVEAVARSAQIELEVVRRYDEGVDSWWHRMNRCGLWAAALHAGAMPADVQFFDAESMAAFAHGNILDAAANGRCVIVGRGAQCVLQEDPQALHVFVYAPWSDRVARVRNRVETRDIEQLIQSTDRRRAAHIRKYFGRNWTDSQLYHMMMNSELGCENVARSIIDVAEHAELAALLESVTL